MQDRTGYIVTPEEQKRLEELRKKFYRWETCEFPGGPVTQMEIPPTKQQLLRDPPRVTRNERCPCGSGVKYKKCCGSISQNA